MNPNIITLDVRADFRTRQSRCDKIKNALSRVGHREALRLLVPFQPLPLVEIARAQGLNHEARQFADDGWEVLFSHCDEGQLKESPTETSGCDCGCHSTEPAEWVALDARGLEPPQPMVKILEALAALPATTELCACTDRRPIHLYPPAGSAWLHR